MMWFRLDPAVPTLRKKREGWGTRHPAVSLLRSVHRESLFAPKRAFKYPSFTRHFCRRTLSSNSAKARVIVSCSGRAFSRSSACPVPRGSFANSSIFSQSAGGLMLTTDYGFPHFLYVQNDSPILFFSRDFTICA